MSEAWRADAVCLEIGTEPFFPEDETDNTMGKLAQRVCMTCPVQAECLAFSLEHEIEYGIWGGVGRRKRQIMLKGNFHGAKV